MEDLTFDPEFYSETMDDIINSQGFYVTPAVDGAVLLGGVRREFSGGDRYRKAERAAKFAMEEHNKKAGEVDYLKFIAIVNLNVEPAAGAIYLITAVVADAAGEVCRYQMRIWEKLNAGYQVQIFRPAPYWLKSSEKLAHKYCCVTISNLMQWMDENYLYYKCFMGAPKIFGVEVCRGEGDRNKAYLWLRNSAEIERIVNKYGGRKMPHSNIFYTFDLNSHPTSVGF